MTARQESRWIDGSILKPRAAPFVWGLFIFYLLWNVVWLLNGRPAPSMLLGLLGIPAPTTGMTRALVSLSEGDWRQSLLWNPLAVPLLLLFVTTLAWSLLKPRPRQREMLYTWLLLLGVAWCFKWALGPAYW